MWGQAQTQRFGISPEQAEAWPKWLLEGTRKSQVGTVWEAVPQRSGRARARAEHRLWLDHGVSGAGTGQAASSRDEGSCEPNLRQLHSEMGWTGR